MTHAPRSCGTCQYWYALHEEIGECRYNPPVLVVPQHVVFGVFPGTIRTAWCGCYSHKEGSSASERVLEDDACEDRKP